MRIHGKEILATDGKYMYRKCDAEFASPLSRCILLPGESEDDFVEFDNKQEYTPAPEQLREMAYRAEADQYLMAYEGYIAEGKIAEADEQKTLYMAKKAEIRERFPDK